MLFSLRNKLLILMIIPLLAFLIVSVLFMTESAKGIRSAQQAEVQMQAINELSKLITAIQKERGASISNLFGLDTGDTLAQSRQEVAGIWEKNAAVFQSRIDPTQYATLESVVAGLETQRANVDNKTYDDQIIFNDYTTSIATLLEVFETVAVNPDAEIQEIFSYISTFEYAKDSISRAVVLSTIYIAKDQSIFESDVVNYSKAFSSIEIFLNYSKLKHNTETKNRINALTASADWTILKNAFITIVANASTGAYNKDAGFIFTNTQQLVDRVQALIDSNLAISINDIEAYQIGRAHV